MRGSASRSGVRLAHNMDRMLCLEQSDLGDAGGRGNEKEGRKGEDALGRDENDGADEKRSCTGWPGWGADASSRTVFINLANGRRLGRRHCLHALVSR